MTSPEQRQRRVEVNAAARTPSVREALPSAEARIRQHWVSALCFLMAGRMGSHYDPEAIAAHKSSWDGGRTPQGRRVEPAWPKFVQLEAQGIDVCELIDCFLETWPGVNLPQPQMAYAESVVNLYFQRPTPELRLAKELKLQQAYAERQFWILSRNVVYQTVPQVWRAIVFDRTAPLSPLFRYCLALDAKLPESEQLRGPALVQYQLKAAIYSKVWGPLLPSTIAAGGAA